MTNAVEELQAQLDDCSTLISVIKPPASSDASNQAATASFTILATNETLVVCYDCRGFAVVSESDESSPVFESLMSLVMARGGGATETAFWAAVGAKLSALEQ